MLYELTQIEAADRTVARCQSRIVGFHPTLTELPALFGMPNQGFNAGSTIRKAGTSCRLSLRKIPESQTRVLETTRLCRKFCSGGSRRGSCPSLWRD